MNENNVPYPSVPARVQLRIDGRWQEGHLISPGVWLFPVVRNRRSVSVLAVWDGLQRRFRILSAPEGYEEGPFAWSFALT